MTTSHGYPNNNFCIGGRIKRIYDPSEVDGVLTRRVTLFTEYGETSRGGRFVSHPILYASGELAEQLGSLMPGTLACLGGHVHTKEERTASGDTPSAWRLWADALLAEGAFSLCRRDLWACNTVMLKGEPLTVTMGMAPKTKEDMCTVHMRCKSPDGHVDFPKVVGYGPDLAWNLQRHASVEHMEVTARVVRSSPKKFTMQLVFRGAGD